MTGQVNSSEMQQPSDDQIRFTVIYKDAVINGVLADEVVKNIDDIIALFHDEIKEIDAITSTIKKSGGTRKDDYEVTSEQVVIGTLFHDFWSTYRSPKTEHGIFPNLVSAYANLDTAKFKEEVKSKFFSINLERLLNQYGFNAEDLEKAMEDDVVGVGAFPILTPQEIKDWANAVGVYHPVSIITSLPKDATLEQIEEAFYTERETLIAVGEELKDRAKWDAWEHYKDNLPDKED